MESHYLVSTTRSLPFTRVGSEIRGVGSQCPFLKGRCDEIVSGSSWTHRSFVRHRLIWSRGTIIPFLPTPKRKERKKTYEEKGGMSFEKKKKYMLLFVSESSGHRRAGPRLATVP